MKPIRLSIWMIFILACLWLAGCSTLVRAPSAQVKSAQVPISTPKKAITTADTGAIRLQLVDNTSGKPVPNKLVFLANLLPVKGQSSQAYIPALDMTTAPKDTTDTNGLAVISGAKPQKYAVTLMSPAGPILLKDMETGEDMLVDITAGKVLDLGIKKVSVPEDMLIP